MEITIQNPQKGRMETIDVEFTDKNTTWFENCENDDDVRNVYKITDFKGCLLITEFGYRYPILIYDKSRKDIEYDKYKAYKLRSLYE